MASLLYFCLDCIIASLIQLAFLAYLTCRASGGWPPLTRNITTVILSRQKRVWQRAKKNWPEHKHLLLVKGFLVRLLPVLCVEVAACIGYPYFLRWQQIDIYAYDYVRLPVMVLSTNITLLIILIAGDDDTSSDHAPQVAPPLPRLALPLPTRPRPLAPAPRPLLRTNKALHPPARREPAQGLG